MSKNKPATKGRSAIQTLPENPPGEPTGQTTRVATANYKDPNGNWQSQTTRPPAPDSNPQTENQTPGQGEPDINTTNQTVQWSLGKCRGLATAGPQTSPMTSEEHTSEIQP